MKKSEKRMTRRTFLGRAASVVAGATMGTTALSYGRILGANDRISLGIIGMGSFGQQLAWIISQLKDKKNVETTAVCDTWRVYREKASAAAEKAYGRAPRAVQNLERVLGLKDIDGVVIATPEHQHALQLRMAAEAGKHVWVEKAMANVLEEAKAARDAVVARPNLIVQVGTQHRSEPFQIATRRLIRTGVLGEISKVETVWNLYGPRWKDRPEIKQTREEDVDWLEFLMPRPYRPFDPEVYWDYRLYRGLSSGIPDGLMCHNIDLIHWFMDDHFPKSVVAQGGIYAWHDGRENPDTFQALLEYPKGFIVSYSCSFGNNYPSFTGIMGKNATLERVGAEGSPRWKLVDRKDVRSNEVLAEKYVLLPKGQGYIQVVGEDEDTWKYVLVPGDKNPPPTEVSDLQPEHMINWLDCMRSGKQPNAPIQAGFAHSVACIMSDLSYREGKKMYWDPTKELILDNPPTPAAFTPIPTMS